MPFKISKKLKKRIEACNVYPSSPKPYSFAAQMKERRQYKRSMKSYIPPHDRSGANSSQAHHTTPARGQPSLSLAAGRSHQKYGVAVNGTDDSRPNNHAQKDANEEASVSLTDTLSKWQQVSKVLIKNYINSHQLHGHADPCLDSPITVGTRPEHCDCTIRQLSRRINGFMMFSKYRNRSARSSKVQKKKKIDIVE